MTFPHATGNSRASYWILSTPSTDHPPLAEDVRADVAVVGAGIAGLTSAYLLAKAGRSVVVVDRERLATAESGHTTAHLQIVDDTRLADLVARFGIEKAKARWDSHHEAVRTIETLAHEERISCDLERLDGYLYTPRDDQVDMLRKEAELARRIGYEVEEASPDDLPFPAKAVLRYPHQGKFHPRKYFLALAKRAEALGVRFYEGTEVAEIDKGTPAAVRTRDGHAVTADHVLVCTNTPFHVRVRMHTKIFPYRTYVIGARVPKGTFRDALYWDTLDPYHYTRVERDADGRDLVILGGEDHKVGHETDTGVHHDALLTYLRASVPEAELVYRWSGQINETEDDYPYIGRTPGGPANVLLATGFSGTGMTNGTIAGVMLAEQTLGRGTPWDELFDPGRVTAKADAVGEWVAENADVAKSFVQGRLRRSEVEDPAALRVGEGGILRAGARLYGVCRTGDGELHAVGATCTHMACTVNWNRSEQSWDCPCHGSRFTPTGEILHGPAQRPLEAVDVERLTTVRKRA